MATLPQLLFRRRQLLGFAALAALAGCASVVPAALDDSAQQDLAAISAYLNDIRTLHARFVQVGADGAVSRGSVWMQRPGRLRLEYDPPSQAVLLAANGQVVLHDAATEATTRMSLARTPLAMLLGPEILLSGPVSVTQFDRAPGQFVVALVSTEHPGQGTLSLTLRRAPLRLAVLQMADARGNVTRLALQDVQIGGTPPEGIFRPAV
jgi:outer membrane lipoprotein-sorting protein